MIDFHCHSTASDGSLSPSQLVRLAVDNGISHLALTDHDTTDGLDEFLSYSNQLKLIPGIELSVNHNVGQLHIVGLFIDKSSKAMIELVNEVKEYRKERNDKLLAKISKLLKKNITLSDILENNKNGFLGRPHIAKYFVKIGLAYTMQEAFNKYLGDGMALSVPKTQISIERAIDVIKKSQGISILAHPITLKLDDIELDKTLKKYKDLGLDGIEVFSSKSPNEKIETYLSMAKKHDLLVSCGSDYHGNNSKVLSLGADIGNYDKEKIINPITNRAKERGWENFI